MPASLACADERVAAGMLSERERHRQPQLFGIDDLVGRHVLQHPVLVDPGLVRERVRSDDRLVALYGVAGRPRDEGDVVPISRDVDAGLRVELGGADAECHHDLLERGVAGPLADPVDGALDLSGAGGDAGERVRRRASPRSLWQWTERVTRASSGQCAWTSRRNAVYSAGRA